MQIQPFVQDFVHAVASILDAPVTVVDNMLIRVGGTAEYEALISRKVAYSTFYDQVLKTGKPAFVKNVKNDQACCDCENRSNCLELADMAYPIFWGKEVAGVIGILAFNEEEQQMLLHNQDKLSEFLKYMSMLIESRLATQKHSLTLENQIDDVVNNERKHIQEAPLLGKSKGIRDIIELVRKISASDSTILLSGESGTGKEMMARTIHNLSPRGRRLMTSINCGAIPDNLVESELFGYEGGAFTGARREGHIGKFELADKSTLFLDEVGEMPLPVQTKLLRVLQEKSVQRLGGSESVAVDVRIVCATNRNLWEMVNEGLFRNDLYYRLNVIPIHMPPLRERREDIPIFIKQFLTQYNQTLHKSIEGLDEECLQAFMTYDWPGNIRELRNIIEYLVNIVDGSTIRAVDLPQQFLFKTRLEPGQRTLKEMMAAHERLLLGNLISNAQTAAQKQELAKELRISSATLYRKLSEHKLLG